MKKTDISIKNITIASIKRHTTQPFDFKYSDIYENDKVILNERVGNQINFEDGEELICSTIINDSIWSVLTTRRIITLEGVGKVEHYLSGLKRRDAGDFKGYSKQEYTKGFLHFDDDKIIPYFIETGKASMIMIYGVNTTTQQL
ncbi:hypothetical protein [Flavivirga algicola]|uniref:Uncharacterized protein n=1 Tax=Flavivirga algicola TaxID=2729136 RepID=A0ABX1S1B7_9FLAO|nr:hypothetical protein [Flavivirga algicola]NMH89018.1 hypothetical protein [Flavivirga algicola]